MKYLRHLWLNHSAKVDTMSCNFGDRKECEIASPWTCFELGTVGKPTCLDAYLLNIIMKMTSLATIKILRDWANWKGFLEVDFRKNWLTPLEDYFIKWGTEPHWKEGAQFHGSRACIKTTSILLSYSQSEAVILVSTEIYPVMCKSANMLLYA